MSFTGTKNYVATKDLQMAVNAAVILERPLLIKGEPGTGKTLLAEEVAQALNMLLIQMACEVYHQSSARFVWVWRCVAA